MAARLTPVASSPACQYCSGTLTPLQQPEPACPLTARHSGDPARAAAAAGYTVNADITSIMLASTTPASGGGSSHVGAIVGGIVGGLVALALLVVLVAWLALRQRRRQHQKKPVGGADAKDGAVHTCQGLLWFVRQGMEPAAPCLGMHSDAHAAQSLPVRSASMVQCHRAVMAALRDAPSFYSSGPASWLL